MTATKLATRAPFSAITLALIGLSVAAWIATLAWARSAGMGAMPGTMGMNLVAFVVMWALMMGRRAIV